MEHYIASCERVVAKQLQIEENRRNADILLQKLRDEVWSAPKNIELPESNSISAVALGIIVGADENDSSDEEFDSRPNTLSVSSGKGKLEEKHEKFKKRDDQVGSLQVEKTRTELEANLYLGLRLSTELEEVEKLMSTSKQLLQVIYCKNTTLKYVDVFPLMFIIKTEVMRLIGCLAAMIKIIDILK